MEQSLLLEVTFSVLQGVWRQKVQMQHPLAAVMLLLL